MSKNQKWTTVISKKVIVPQKNQTKQLTIKKNVKQIVKSIDDNISNDDEYDQNKNMKKILCRNMITCGECKYGSMCMYAHSLDEQNVNIRRKEAYDIIKGTDSLEHIDLRKNFQLYKTLLELTKYCKNCDENKCAGGYNCKSGACSKNLCVCITDLNYGNCKNSTCTNIHLTTRNLAPYNKKKTNDIINNDDNFVTYFKSNNNIHSDCSSDISSEITIDSESENEFINVDVTKENYINIMCNKSIFE
jgi:hypothetical protein